MKLRKFRAERGSSGVLAMRAGALADEYGQAKSGVDEDDGIAIVHVTGPLEHHFCWWFDSYEAIVMRTAEAMAEGARAVVMCFDSPGGDASGVEESHRKLRTMSEESGIPIFAYSNESCYSAAYWLAAAAKEIWVPPTGGVGSVGVIAAAVDCTAANAKAGVRVELITTGDRKADGHPDRPLTDEIIETLQARVDQIGKVFFASVAESRSMSSDAVRALQAGCFLGDDAVGAGLADGVAGWDEFLALVRNEVSGDPGIDTPTLGGVDHGGSGPIGSARRNQAMKAKTKLSLTKAQNDARAAIEAAKTPEERKAALKALESATEMLAKMKYSKKTVEESEEDDGEESEEEESEESDDEPPPSKKDKGDDDEGDDDDDAEEEETDEDAEDEEADEDADEGDSKKMKSLKALAGKAGKPRVEELFRAACALTGETNVSRVIGALSGIKVKVDRADKLHADVSKLKSTQRRADVDAMLAKASRDGKVSPAATASLRAQGLKDPKWLKGHLAALPKNVRTPDRAALPDTEASANVAKLSAESMSAEDRKVIDDARAGTGLSFDAFVEKMNTKSKTVGFAPTH